VSIWRDGAWLEGACLVWLVYPNISVFSVFRLGFANVDECSQQLLCQKALNAGSFPGIFVNACLKPWRKLPSLGK
jgi:hypothetical protein